MAIATKVKGSTNGKSSAKAGGTTVYDERDLSSGGAPVIEGFPPYTVEVQIVGIADLLFNRFNEEEMEAKSKAKRGSEERKTDIPENRVYRDRDGLVCLPGQYLKNSIVAASKYFKDPRQPRASAVAVFKAGIFPESDLAPIVSVTGETTREGWDYLDKRGACVQRARIVRSRPAFFKGWSCTHQIGVSSPEYITPDWLHEVLSYAGKMCGTGDFRPDYGRFRVSRFEVLEV